MSLAWVYPTFPSVSDKIRYSMHLNNGGVNPGNYLQTTKTLASATTLTYSVWVKLQASSTAEWLFGAGTEFGGGATRFSIRLGDTSIDCTSRAGGVIRGASFTVSSVDDDAWHHVFIQLNTTEGTDTNRVKCWLDGVAKTPAAVGTGYFTSSQAVTDDGGTTFYIGHKINSGGSGQELNAYMAAACLVDGTIVDISKFGKSTSGGWEPVRYRGSAGTEGFILEFADSTNLGKDSAGNGDWTETETADLLIQVTDTPSV